MIYFARCGHDGPVKIGHTIGGIASRISFLQVGCPWQIEVLGTLEGDMKAETAMLKKFSHLNMRGEWFHAADELMLFIEANATATEVRPSMRNVVAPFTEASMDDENWAGVIRQVMRLKKWRQIDVAEALGMHQAMISKWLSGKFNPGRESRLTLRALLSSAQQQVAA